ncbi:MAG: DJ-1/PfpI family protein, partial [Janthinobacterium lividum]
MARLDGKKVAILVANGFEQIELTEPRQALDTAGAVTVLISPVAGQVQGMNHDQFGDKLPVDLALSEARAADYDALLLPGGVANPDTLRTLPEAVRFVKAFFEAEKPVAY